MQEKAPLENPIRLHLLCGKMASGKSTLAKRLAQQHSAVLLSEDDLLATLYPGEISDVASYAERAKRLKKAVSNLVVSLLANGNSVVMDFPANTLSQRKWLVELSKQAKTTHLLHYIDVPDETCKLQLKKRVSENPERAATDTTEMFDAITRHFEAPSLDEGLNIKMTV